MHAFGVIIAALSGGTSPPDGGTPVWVIVVAAIGASALTFLGQLLLRRQERDKLIANATGEVVEQATEMLEQYRIALREARDEINELRERVAKLEEQLRVAKDARDKIEAQRIEAILELARVQGRVENLEHQISLIEGRSSPPGDEGT